MTERPPILDRKGRIHPDVRGFIFDRKGELCGVIIVKPDKNYFEFFGKYSPLLVYDKITGEAEVCVEIYPDNPKRIMRKIYDEQIKKGGR